MLAGLGLAAFELRYGLVLARLGLAGRIVVLTCATGFSVWGLKEVIAGWWPALGHRGFVRHRSAFPTEGRLYLLIMFVLFAGSMMGRSNPLMLVFALMAGPFVVNGWISFVILKRVEVWRKVPSRVMAGEPTSVEVVLRNNKRWLSAWVLTLRDQITGFGEHLSAEVVVARVPPRGEQRAHYRLRLVQRGRYALGPMQISTRFPLGLVERSLNVALTDSLLVHPRIGRLTANWKQRLACASELVTQTAPRGGPFDDEFHKLREYRAGDDPRAIHWRTSARRNELMVREFQESRDRDLIVLLDAWQPARPGDDDVDRVELAISFAATVCVDHLRSSRESGLFCAMAATEHAHLGAGRHACIEWHSSSAGGGVESLLDELALLRPYTRDDLVSLLHAGRTHSRSRGRTLLISTRPDHAAQAVFESARATGDSLLGSEAVQIIAADEAVLAAIVDWR
jgi:uncharacterized protein (DUF58 family)